LTTEKTETSLNGLARTNTTNAKTIMGENLTSKVV